MTRLDVFEAVVLDLIVREAIGFAQHKKPLLADDPGRDWLQEAYEEALDQAVYLKAALMRRELSAGSSQASGVAVRPPVDYDGLLVRWERFAVGAAFTGLLVLLLFGIAGLVTL